MHLWIRRLFDEALIRYRNLLLVLAGVTGLLLKRFFAEFLEDFALSYVGNLSASFAVYFIITIAAIPKLTQVMVVMLALLVVKGF